jgi:hypothetical protein
MNTLTAARRPFALVLAVRRRAGLEPPASPPQPPPATAPVAARPASRSRSPYGIAYFNFFSNTDAVNNSDVPLFAAASGRGTSA